MRHVTENRKSVEIIKKNGLKRKACRLNRNRGNIKFFCWFINIL